MKLNNVNKDVVHNVARVTNRLKIPITNRYSGNSAVTGDIILDKSAKTFYGYTGFQWVPFHGNYAPVTGYFVTWAADSSLPNSRTLTGGDNITITNTGTDLVINAATVTLNNASEGIPLRYSLVNDGIGPDLAVKSLSSGNGGLIIIPGDTNITIGVGGSPPSVDASFITVTFSAGLANERVLATGNDLYLVDGGPNSIITMYTTYNRKEINTSYTALINDDIIAVSTIPGPISGAITVTLPIISSLLQNTAGKKYKKYTIVDEAGIASTYNISVVAAGGQRILDQVSPNAVVINENYNSISVYSDGVSAWYLY